jgi:hypothetical protein
MRNPPRKHTTEKQSSNAHELWEQNGKHDCRDDEFYDRLLKLTSRQRLPHSDPTHGREHPVVH